MSTAIPDYFQEYFSYLCFYKDNDLQFHCVNFDPINRGYLTAIEDTLGTSKETQHNVEILLQDRLQNDIVARVKGSDLDMFEIEMLKPDEMIEKNF